MKTFVLISLISIIILEITDLYFTYKHIKKIKQK